MQNTSQLIFHADQIVFIWEEHWPEMRHGPVLSSKNIEAKERFHFARA